MSNLVIVAIPDENDRVWKISSEKIPHLTLLFLGDSDQVSNADQIVQFVEHAANQTLRRFYLPVDRRDELGDDPDLGPADVLFFKKGRYDYKAVRDFRAQLLKDDNIRTAYDSATQFDGVWLPHLTLGYEKRPAKTVPDDLAYSFYDVSFNKIAVWLDDFDGPEFLLKDYWDEYESLESVPMDVSMSDIRDDLERDPHAELGAEFLAHHGVKGQKWGVRKVEGGGDKAHIRINQKTGAATVSNKTLASLLVPAVIMPVLLPVAFLSPRVRAEVKATRAVNKGVQADKKWKKEFTSAKRGVEVHNKAADEINSKLPGFNKDKRWLHPDGKEIDLTKDSAKQSEYDKAVVAEVINPAYSRAAIAVHGAKSPGGRYNLEIQDHDTATLRVRDTFEEARQAKHAADGEEVSIQFKIMRNSTGHILGFDTDDELKEMSQSAIDIGSEFVLEHYGVKGMQWGVRKDPRTGLTPGETKREGVQRFLDPTGHALSTDVAKLAIGYILPVVAPLTWPAQIRMIRGGTRGVQKKLLDNNEKKFAKNAMSPKNFAAIHNGSVEKTNRDIDAINKKYPNGVSRDRPKEQRKYNDEVLKALQDAYRESANAIGSKSGKQHLDVEFVNDGLDFKIHARQGAPTPQAKRVQHAAEDDLANEEITVEITGKIKRDAKGYIVGLDFDHLESGSPVQHTIDIGSVLVSTLLEGDTLEHYGVKGMQWGVRRRSEPSAVTPSARSRVPHGNRRKTQIKTEGGQNHPAHTDAIKVAEARAKFKKSGPSALSNQELRDMANRLQLENQVALLTSSRGKQFVSRQFETETKNLARAGVREGARAAGPRVLKKARRTAATAATIAALA